LPTAKPVRTIVAAPGFKAAAQVEKSEEMNRKDIYPQMTQMNADENRI